MMITRRLVFAMIAVATTPPLIAWAFRSEPKPPRPTPTLSDRLNEVDADLPAAKKEDRLPEARAVRTIPITQPVEINRAAAPAAAIGAEASERLRSVVLTPPPEADEDPPPRRKAKRHANTHAVASLRGDVCSRHNMRKVTTRGGKSWRCRRR
jgi:hypothetical protein